MAATAGLSLISQRVDEQINQKETKRWMLTYGDLQSLQNKSPQQAELHFEAES